MRITVFTANQPRHISLLYSLAEIADEVYAVQECGTVFPGQVKDFFNNSPTMRNYFEQVIAAEKKIFGTVRFSSPKVRTMSIRGGDLNLLPLDYLKPALASDYYVIFGSSFIKSPLIDFLVEHKAINIHMGVSPYYRGSSCNFWAMYDGSPEMVGATIHWLSKGLDSGDMLFHALPQAATYAPFELGMYAVKAAHESLAARIGNGQIKEFEAVKQDKSLEVRYTRNSDFDDVVAGSYLKAPPTSQAIFEALSKRDLGRYHRPYIATGDI